MFLNTLVYTISVKAIQNLIASYRSLSTEDRRNVVLLVISYFLILFGYSLLRTVATALYLQTFGARETPLVSFISVFVLLATLALINRLQKSYSIQAVFGLTSLLSCAIFLSTFISLSAGFKPAAHILFIWKEVYIVFVIHMTWGYINNFIKKSSAKYLFGYIAAMGSLGGIVGGLLPSVITRSFGPGGVITAGVIQLFITAVLFFKTIRLSEEVPSLEKPNSPVGSLDGVRPYVLYLAALVILSQFVISIADFQFNVQFQNAFPNITEKVNNLGLVFALINGLTLLFMVALLPFLYSFISNERLQLLIPIAYLTFIAAGFGAGSGVVWSVALSFSLLKSMDYSVFSVSKELLYYPLKPTQKYGAKYLIDIFSYRFAKAVISFVLIFIQGAPVLTGMLSVFLVTWIVLVWLFGPKPVVAVVS